MKYGILNLSKTNVCRLWLHVQYLWLLVVLCHLFFIEEHIPSRPSKSFLKTAHTHTRARVWTHTYTRTSNTDPQHPWKARHSTTFLALPVKVTIATPSSLPWLPHWLEERHGYTNAAKNLNELNDTLPGLNLILPFTTSHAKHAHMHTNARSDGMWRQKFTAGVANICVVLVPEGTTLIMASASLEIRLIYKWHLLKMSSLMNTHMHTYTHIPPQVMIGP